MSQSVDNSLHSDNWKQQIKNLVLNLKQDQLIWLDGYVSGLQDANSGVSGSSELVSANSVGSQLQNKKLRVLYGSHSGNGVKISSLIKTDAEKLGIACEVSSMADYNGRNLKDEEQLLFIVSTHGEGEPPIAAEDLYHYLSGKKAPKFNQVPYAVIALGDSAYKKYCQTGIDFYEFMKKQGANPVMDVVKLDLDFQDHIHTIIPTLLSKFVGSGYPQGAVSSPSNSNNLIGADIIVETPVFERIQLNGKGSEKETWHVEVSTENTGLSYEPGDALEIYASNDPKLVLSIIEKLNLSADEKVDINGDQITLFDALQYHYELTITTPQVVKNYAAFLGNDFLNQLIDNFDQLDEYLEGTDLLDLLTDYPTELSATQLISVLRKLPPRLYSISSSQEEVGDEVHITVGAVRFNKNNRERGGICSTFLADRLGDDENLKVKIRPNLQFRLPKNNDAPIIMIGAGTGIAPFRSFVQHRDATNAKGKNWLFFGDQHFATDFLYQAEWLNYRKKGLLTRMDVAFSRDQKDKIYVQNRLAENAEELYKWLNEGAHIYICGDMKRMAKDVRNTLIDIISQQGKKTLDDAADLLRQLRKEGRYQEDVY